MGRPKNGGTTSQELKNSTQEVYLILLLSTEFWKFRFSKALSHFGNSVSEFVVHIHLFFKLSLARKEDYKNVQEELGIQTHSIETIPEALIEMEISHKEFITILKDKDKYEKMKENLRSENEKYEIMRLISTKSKT